MIGFPLLLIPLAIVNIAVFLMGLGLDRLQEPVVSVGLPSLQSWTITYSDLLLSLSLLLLLVEVVKSARPGSKYFTDHFLSVLVFAAAAAEFLLLPQFASSAFFLLTLMAFVDVVAGISIRMVRPKIAAVRAPAPEPVVHTPPAPPPPPAPAAPEVRPAPPVVVEETRPVEIAPPAGEADIKVEPRDKPDTPQAEILPPGPTIPRR
ncbi:MAG: hypothetical protein R3D69_00880 [Xanthobacteraceae bacterium]